MTFYAGQPLAASDLQMTMVSNADPTARTTTSTSFTTTLSPANICGISFVAPPSGKVLIICGAQCSNGSSPNIAQASFGIRQGDVVGSGTVFQASGDSTTVTSIASVGASRGSPVTGLTPGTIYNVAMEHRAFSAGTATFLNREVIVQPQLA